MLEPVRGKFSVADCVLDIGVAQVRLKGTGIAPCIRQREAAGVPQHVRVNL
jgi:hypothetical protein